MKSKFFAEASLSDSAKKSIKAIVGLEEQAREAIASLIMAPDGLPRVDNELVARLSAESGEPASDMREAISGAYYLLYWLGRAGDDVDDVIADARSRQLFDTKSHYEVLGDFLRRTQPAARQCFLAHKAWSATDRVLPTIDYSSMSVSITPVYERPFRYGGDDLATYDPRLCSYIALVQLGLETTDSYRRFSFQLDAEGFNRLISEMLAVQRKLQDAEKLATELTKRLDTKDED